jgi:catechol 2,3-dioxygenase-like lactoylglutathione lyase family enzyme
VRNAIPQYHPCLPTIFRQRIACSWARLLARQEEPERGLEYWADPGQKQKGQINRHYGGRGVYFEDPSGHLLEIITRPYGNELP